ncbi:MAG TPA: AraC family transcriptional regulator [Desulfotomaculum sp.]|nr:AraC family transcriptional regulator [Desulfotomaculum sp.]
MSELKSKVAYLQGLLAGMNLDQNSREGQLFQSIIGVLDDFANSFEELEKVHDHLEDYVESVDEDLSLLEDRFYEEQCDTFDDTDYVEIKCPGCGEIVCFDPGVLSKDDVVKVSCPNCDEVVFINDDDFQSADEPEMLEGRAGLNDEEDI